MSIVTQCPSCATTFRVTPPQLQAQHGMVRCGRCAQVFDGFKTLATLPEAPSEAAPPPPATAPEMSAPVPVAAAAVVAEPPSHAAPAVDEATLTRPPVTVEPPLYESPALDLAPPRRRNVGWGIGVALMLCGLAAQAAYFYRSDIAASLPEARPQLNRMCELLHCTVALPQRPRQISIEASDMQAPDPANPGLVALTATLRNHATTALGYPALDVVLTNTKEHTVARRIFMPAEYLMAGKDPRAGIAPNAEVTIRLDLDTGDLGAAGFRLDLIAAPAR
jgi:predicted Zn finger-like uncharacterized protein